MYIRVPPPDRPTAHLVQGDSWTREELEYIQVVFTRREFLHYYYGSPEARGLTFAICDVMIGYTAPTMRVTLWIDEIVG